MSTEAILLGTAQDAGLPQVGCDCRNCSDAHAGLRPREYAVSLAIVDHGAGASWLVDATPDFREQYAMLRALAPACPLQGILLTHAHAGHYTGLQFLGRESMNSRAMPLHASASMLRFLCENGPWSQLVAIGNVEPRELQPGRLLALGASLRVTPIPVPHRGEYSDTLAFVFEGTRGRLFYCPDIDRWEDWELDIAQVVDGVTTALLDGTFHDGAELPGRDLSQIPHPTVVDTVSRLGRPHADVRFVHLNHTNPLHREGPEATALRAAGFGIGAVGDRFVL